MSNVLAKFTGTYSPHAAGAGGETQPPRWDLLWSSREAAFVFQLHMHLLPNFEISRLHFGILCSLIFTHRRPELHLQ